MNEKTVSQPNTDSSARQPIAVLAHAVASPPSTRITKLYSIAGQKVRTDLDSPWLVPFRISESDMHDGWLWATSLQLSAPHLPALTTAYEGEDWIGNERVSLRCQYSEEGYLVAIGDVGDFYVRADGSSIVCQNLNAHAEPDVVAIAVLGAPFLLACALRDTWCLHGSAVTLQSGIVAFVGESGQGKSTIARYMAVEGGVQFGLAGDDTLPVATNGDRTDAYPRYPQFKLSVDGQPSGDLHESLPLLAVFLLASPTEGGANVSVARTGNADSALVIAGNTVASRLFGRPLLAKHLAFCARMAGTTPLYRLEYPRTYAALPEVREAVYSCIMDQVR